MIPTIKPGVLTVAVFTGFEPFAFRHPRRGELVGFDIDILAGFGRAIELPIEYRPTGQFDGIWHIPGRGEADLATAGIARFEERLSPDIAWSVPYFQVMRSILVHRSRALELEHIDRFSGRTIAFVGGSTADLDTRARAPADARLRPVTDQTEGMRLLASGAIDGLAMGAPSNEHNRRLHPDYALVDVHRFQQSEDLRFPLAASNSELLIALDDHLASAHEDGTINRAFQHWMGG